MSLVHVVFDSETQEADFAEDEFGHISLGAGLETAALYSLLSNRRAPDVEELEQPYGWWADNFPEVDGDEFGSHVWLEFGRSKLDARGLRRLQLAASDCYAWMKRDGLAKSVTVTVQRENNDLASFAVQILQPNGGVFSEIWKVHTDAV